VATPVYRFGEFRLDLAGRELRRGDEEIHLPVKVFACIVVLIENRHRAVGRDELIATVWGHVHLTDSVLGQVIRQARHALGDTGDDQRVIRTVRGFGYRWAAPVGNSASLADARVATARPSGSTWRRRVALPVVAALSALVSAASAPLPEPVKSQPSSAIAVSHVPIAGDTIALLLPVSGASAPDTAWMRLGLMDFIASRLRAAGQPVVPSDTVIALLHNAIAPTDAAQLDMLTSATHARLVLGAEVRKDGLQWHVSLHSVAGVQPAIDGHGDSADVLAAARTAADHLAVVLGREPPPPPNGKPGLDLLVQQIAAARLAQKPDIARHLIEAAPEDLRSSAEIRFEQARIDFYNNQLDATESVLGSLLSETSSGHDPVLRARALNGLASVHAIRGDRVSAESMMLKAARLLEDRDAPETLNTLGTIWVNLGNVAQEQGHFELARGRMAQARRIFEGTGNVAGLASLDSNVGVLETRREHYAGALKLFESAAERHAALQDVGGELTDLAYVVMARLLLLDTRSASTVEPRLKKLLAQTSNPALVARAQVCLADLFRTNGRARAASDLLNQVMTSTEARPDLHLFRIDAQVMLAEQGLRVGNTTHAAQLAGGIVDRLAADPGGLEADNRGRAWLVLVRANLDRHDLATASKASAAMTAWAQGDPATSPKIYAAIAQAELDAARGLRPAAMAAYEQALALADHSHVPLWLLCVVKSYVPWLLEGDRGAEPDRNRALLVADRVADYADRDFDAALIQLRVYQVLGPAAAWRTALAHARALAGERAIPVELRPPS
jgi:DNA-binding winged helix-turn-helix (wHTH) protein/tetratricopeptide (TPR) repeat protein